MKHKLSRENLQSQKKEIVQIFAMILSTSEGIKYQNKSSLLATVLDSDLWHSSRQKAGVAKPVTPKLAGATKSIKPPKTRVPTLASASPSPSPLAGRERHEASNLGIEGALGIIALRASEEEVKAYGSASPPGMAESVGEGTRAVKEKVAAIISRANENHFPPVDMTITFGPEGEKALEVVKSHEEDIRNRLKKMVEEQKSRVMAEVETIGKARLEVAEAEAELEQARLRLEQAQRVLDEKRRRAREGEIRARKPDGSPQELEDALKKGLESPHSTANECDVALRRYLQMRKVAHDEPDFPMDDAGMSKSVQAHAAVSESLKVYQSLRRQMEAHLPKSAWS